MWIHNYFFTVTPNEKLLIIVKHETEKPGYELEYLKSQASGPDRKKIQNVCIYFPRLWQ